MVKKKVGGGKRYQAAVKAKAQGAPEPSWEGPAPPKHLQRKISKKVNFLDKVAASKSAALAAKSVIVKKGRKAPSRALTDLTSLTGSVSELLVQQKLKAKTKRKKKASAAAGSEKPAGVRREFGHSVGTLRARSAVMSQECERVQQVVQHPLYMKDPIAAITHHLAATLPPAPMQRPQHQAKASSRRKPKRKGGNDRMESD